MISSSTEKALNRQVALEGYASAYYLSMASWCDQGGFDGSAAFLYRHSDEERMHMLKLVHHINSLGGQALSPEIAKIPHRFKSLHEIFELILKHEISVTTEINKLADTCMKQRDYTTFNFLQWYIAEQQEEESLFNRILDKFKIMGTDGKSLYLIDQYIGKLIAKEAGPGESD